MRFNKSILLSLSLLTLSFASPDRQGGLVRRDICTDNSEVDCEQSCMPAGSVCCNDGSSTYCDPGEVCIPGGCCPRGQECSGPGGTQTLILTGTGALPTGNTSPLTTYTTPATAGGNGNGGNTYSVAPLDTSTKAGGGSTPKTSTTVAAGSTHTVSSGGSTPLSQSSGAEGQSRASELFAMAVVAVGQFLLM
jgi:hypothetical protein